MTGLFDGKSIPIKCGGCGHKNEKTIAWIKRNDSLRCAGCGANIELQRDSLLKGLDKAEKTLADLRSNLRKGMTRKGR